MPKPIIFLNSLDSEDKPEIGENFANFAFLTQIGASQSPGFVLGRTGLIRSFERIVPWVISASLGQTKSPNKGEFFDELRKLILKEFEFEDALAKQVQDSSKKLKFPLLVSTQVTKGAKAELNTFEATIFSQKELLPTVRIAFLSFLNQTVLSEVTYESLKNLSIAIAISERPLAELSGKVTKTTGASGKIRIYYQWGEFNPNWTSDLTILNSTNLEEESYNIALQEKQIILKKDKYVTIPVAKNFQFSRKLEADQVIQIANIAKKLSSKMLSGCEFRFVFSRDKLLITDLSVNQDSAKELSNFSLMDYLSIHKHITPLISGIRTGPIRKIVTKNDLRKLKVGEIAALKYFDKKLLPSLRKASGIIIENSKDLTKEQLVLLRKLGKTALTGQIDDLRNKVVTIDGRTGKIYFGAFPPPYTKTFAPTQNQTAEITTKHATTLFVELTHQTDLTKLDENEISGYLINYSNTAEKLILEIGHQHKTVILSSELDKFEVAAALVKNLRNNQGLTNLYLNIPAVNTVKELLSLKQLLGQHNLHRGGSFKLFCTIASPAAALTLSEILELGFDGVVIDFFTLVNKTYGKEFTFNEISKLEDKSVPTLLTQILNQALSHNTYTLLSKLPTDNQTSLLRDLLGKGLKAIATSPESIKETSTILSKLEKELLEHSR